MRRPFGGKAGDRTYRSGLRASSGLLGGRRKRRTVPRPARDATECFAQSRCRGYSRTRKPRRWCSGVANAVDPAFHLASSCSYGSPKRLPRAPEGSHLIVHGISNPSVLVGSVLPHRIRRQARGPTRQVDKVLLGFPLAERLPT